MCGIFAVITNNDKLNYKQKDFMEQATLTGQLRGMHGTGVMLYDGKTKPEVFKRALTGNDFLVSHQGKLAMRRVPDHRIAIGHNRFTTSGGDYDVDCHPFQYEHVTGVHNGGIPGDVLSRLDTKGFSTHVDSAKLYAALNNTDNPIEVLEKIDRGNYALVWVDHRTGLLNICRNDGRPMWASGGTSGLYLSSEPGMLAWLMMRNNLQSDTSSMYEISTNCLYQLHLDDITDVQKKTYKPKAPVYNAPRAANHDYGGRAARNNNDWRGSHNKYHHTRFFSGIDGGIKAFEAELPAMDWYVDSIKEAVDDVENYLHAIGEPLPDAPQIDVKIMKVTATNPDKNGAVFLYAHGIAQTVSNDTIPMPVKIQAVKQEDLDIVASLENAEAEGGWPTCRVEIKGIRCSADGNVLIEGKMVSLWDENWIVTKDEKADDVDMKELTRAIESGFALKDYTEEKLKKCWDSLKVASK